jgi:hypothetical protein
MGIGIKEYPAGIGIPHSSSQPGTGLDLLILVPDTFQHWHFFSFQCRKTVHIKKLCEGGSSVRLQRSSESAV